jgi:hypothetical protein
MSTTLGTPGEGSQFVRVKVGCGAVQCRCGRSMVQWMGGWMDGMGMGRARDLGCRCVIGKRAQQGRPR